jgi:hypothetical protein
VSDSDIVHQHGLIARELDEQRERDRQAKECAGCGKPLPTLRPGLALACGCGQQYSCGPDGVTRCVTLDPAENAEPEVVVLGELAKLEVRPGEILVMMLEEQISLGHMKHYRERILGLCPGVELLFLPPGAKLAVLVKKDAVGEVPS